MLLFRPWRACMLLVLVVIFDIYLFDTWWHLTLSLIHFIYLAGRTLLHLDFSSNYTECFFSISCVCFGLSLLIVRFDAWSLLFFSDDFFQSYAFKHYLWVNVLWPTYSYIHCLLDIFTCKSIINLTSAWLKENSLWPS